MSTANIDKQKVSSMQAGGDTVESISESITPGEYLELLKGGHTFSQSDFDSALLSACRSGYKFLVQTLVRLGASIHKRDTNGNTPLMICVERGLIDIVHFLLSKNADVDVSNYAGDTALILSINPAGSAEMTKLLLQQKRINIHHENRAGYTALMKAVQAMDMDVIMLLLDRHVINGRNHQQIVHYQTILETAERLGISKIVQLLERYRGRADLSIAEAIRTCDLNSFNIMFDIHICDVHLKSITIQNAFEEMFMTHQKDGQEFSDVEVRVVKRLLECGVNVNGSLSGYKPVLGAIQVGSYAVVKLLCDYGADLGSLSHSSRTDPLNMAAKFGRCDIIELLIKLKVKVNAHDFQNSALDCALRHGHIDCAKMLLKHYAHMDLRRAFKSAIVDQLPVYLTFLVENYKHQIKKFFSTSDLNSFLVLAAESGDVNIIGLILDVGAEVSHVGVGGVTPLMKSKNADVVKVLVQRGADVNKPCRDEEMSPIMYILSNHSYRHEPETAGIIQALLESGASASGRHYSDRTTLMLAAAREGSSSVLQVLLDYGADISAADESGNTVLFTAAEKNCPENIKYLLHLIKDKKDFVNKQNNGGSAALFDACGRGYMRVVKHLIDSGADVNLKNCRGDTALLHAVGSHNVEVIQMLIEAGSDVNWQNNDGFSPLMVAAKSSIKPNLLCLIKSGADINAVSKKPGNGTALSLLLESYVGLWAMECVEYLLDQGATSHSVRPDVIHLIIRDGNTQVVTRLIRGGLAPVDIAEMSLAISFNNNVTVSSVSPLCAALLFREVKLAYYFLENLFLTSTDLSSLLWRGEVRDILQRKDIQKCQDFLDDMSTQVMPLSSLAFVAVSSALGAGPGRENRVKHLPVPQVIKDQLMFKNVTDFVKTRTRRGSDRYFSTFDADHYDYHTCGYDPSGVNEPCDCYCECDDCAYYSSDY